MNGAFLKNRVTQITAPARRLYLNEAVGRTMQDRTVSAGFPW